jgi:hypothetical protein
VEWLKRGRQAAEDMAEQYEDVAGARLAAWLNKDGGFSVLHFDIHAVYAWT